jgi:hypothetical protein
MKLGLPRSPLVAGGLTALLAAALLCHPELCHPEPAPFDRASRAQDRLRAESKDEGRTSRPLHVAETPSPSPSPRADPCQGLLAELNRPTVGYSPCAAEHGTAVLELGYQNEEIGTGARGTSQAQAPQGFLRYGFAPHVEVDVFGPNTVAQRGYLGSAQGFTDTGIGFKYTLPPSAQWVLGIDVLYIPPNGSPMLTAGTATSIVNFDASYSVTPATSVGTTLSLATTGGFNVAGALVRYGTFTPSGVVVERIDARTQGYFEYVDDSRISPSYGNRAFIDFGVQHVVGNHLEVDAEFGHALTGDPRLRFNYIGAGIGVLIGD